MTRLLVTGSTVTKANRVRDNIHSLDVARFIHNFYKSPRSAEVDNIGGGRDNSCCILEAFARITDVSGKKMVYDSSPRTAKATTSAT